MPVSNSCNIVSQEAALACNMNINGVNTSPASNVTSFVGEVVTADCPIQILWLPVVTLFPADFPTNVELLHEVTFSPASPPTIVFEYALVPSLQLDNQYKHYVHLHYHYDCT